MHDPASDSNSDEIEEVEIVPPPKRPKKLLSPYSGRAKSGPRSKMGLGKGYGRITDRIPYGCLRAVRPCKLRLRQLGFVSCLARVS
jgi:hypothetical protein